MPGDRIARQLGLPRSTVGAVLRRLGLGRLKALDPTPSSMSKANLMDTLSNLFL